MNMDEKLQLLEAVESSGFKITEALKRLDVPRSTYYRWRAKYRRHGKEGLKDKAPLRRRNWNELLPNERLISISGGHAPPPHDAVSKGASTSFSCSSVSLTVSKPSFKNFHQMLITGSSVYAKAKEIGFISLSADIIKNLFIRINQTISSFQRSE